jgi:hypothetical protein
MIEKETWAMRAARLLEEALADESKVQSAKSKVQSDGGGVEEEVTEFGPIDAFS